MMSLKQNACIFHSGDLDYISRLDHLGLWTLEACRNRANLIEVFKLCKVHTSLPLDRFFQLDTDGRTRPVTENS